jgi:high-affinity Fe2+/Pb2+ permease
VADRRPTDADARVGWPQVLVLAGLVVAVVLGAALLTGLLPTELQRFVFHSPLLILVLIGGTAVVLWRVARHDPGTR